MNFIKRLSIFAATSILILLSVTNVAYAADMNTVRPNGETNKQHIKSTKLNIENLSMVINSTFLLKVFNVDKSSTLQFQSTDENIVTIQEAKERGATLYANNMGSTTITVTVRQEGRSASVLTCNVTVRPPAISVKFQNKRVRLKVGKSKKVVAIVKPNNTKEIPKYSSSDASIASVSSNGIVTMLAPGRARITAVISNGKSASCLVKSKK